MATSVYLGQTQKVFAHFFDWDENPEDPATVEVRILNVATSPDTLVSTEVPTRTDVGDYEYLWTPTVAGIFNIQIHGTFADGSTVPGNNFFRVYEDEVPSADTSILGNDFELVLTGVLDPLYGDPTILQSIFPLASLADIAEQMHYASLDVDTLLEGAEVTALGEEYVQVATACALSRLYDGGGMSGFGGADVALGDLSVRQATQQYRTNVNRGNAGSWCDLAMVIRKELMRSLGKAGMLSTHKASRHTNPIPHRRLRQWER